MNVIAMLMSRILSVDFMSCWCKYKIFLLYRPLHLCIMTWNVAIVKRWVELASREEIADAIDIPSRVGTALCMAAALKKEHEAGKLDHN